MLLVRSVLLARGARSLMLLVSEIAHTTRSVVPLFRSCCSFSCCLCTYAVVNLHMPFWLCFLLLSVGRFAVTVLYVVLGEAVIATIADLEIEFEDEFEVVGREILRGILQVSLFSDFIFFILSSFLLSFR